MTAAKPQGYRSRLGGADHDRTRTDPAILIGAVREDIRQTLRMAWIDPALEAAAAFPVFFTAAWSAIRPNVGRSFLALAKSLRAEAVGTVRSALSPPDLRKHLENGLSEEELRRLEESARAAHLGMAKTQIVVHALHRAARRERISGTGWEEPPTRRGVPDWQRWMSFQQSAPASSTVFEEAMGSLAAPSPPVALRLLSRWPAALSALWDDLMPAARTEAWRAGATRLRRLVLAGLPSLPHPIELQWTALKARGFSDEEREGLVGVLGAYDDAMPGQTLMAAFTWAAFGAPDIGAEG